MEDTASIVVLDDRYLFVSANHTNRIYHITDPQFTDRLTAFIYANGTAK